MYSVRDPASYCLLPHPARPHQAHRHCTPHLTRLSAGQSRSLQYSPVFSWREAKQSGRVLPVWRLPLSLTTPRQPALLACPPGYTLHQHSKHYTLHTGSVSGLFVLSLLFLPARSNSLICVVRNKEMKIKISCAVLTFCHFWIFMSSCNVKTFYEGPQRRSLQPQFHPPFYIEYSRLQSYICSHSSWPLKGLIWKQGQAVV